MNLVKLLRGAHLQYIAYNPGFARHTGSLEAGVLLAHLLNLWGLYGDGFYSKMTHMRNDTGMSEREWRRGMAALKRLGLVRVELRGLPARNHYYIDAAKVVAMLAEIGGPVLEQPNISSYDGVQTGADDGVQTGTDDGVQTGTDDGVRTYKKQLEEAVEEKSSCAPAAHTPDLMAGFADWWEAYGKKVNRKGCAAKWKSAKLHTKAAQLIEDAQRRHKEDAQWRDGFQPHPLTYLNGERWEDEITKTRGNGNAAHNNTARPESAHERRKRINQEIRDRAMSHFSEVG